MPKMGIHKDPEDYLAGQTILGPCPGCDLWTVQFARGDFASVDFIRAVKLERELNDTIEMLLEEHLAECSGLQEIVANTR